MRGKATDYESVINQPFRLGLAQGLLIVALIAVCVSLSNGGDGDVGTSWKAVTMSGEVESHAARGEESDWLAVRRGDELAPRSRLRTADDGSVTLSRRGAVLMVDSGTQLTLPEESFTGALETTQRKGTVVYEANGDAPGALRVTTPGPWLVARHGVFGLTVDGDWSLLSVETGLVEVVSREQDSMDLHAGEALRVHNETGYVEMLRRDEPYRDDRNAARARKAAWKRHRKMRETIARLDRALEQVEAEGGDLHVVERSDARQP